MFKLYVRNLYFFVFLNFLFAFNSAHTQPTVSNLNSGLNPASSTRLFTLRGSDTVGAKLAPSQVKAWMAHLGMDNISVSKLSNLHEYRIIGEQHDHKLYVDIHALGSTTGILGLMQNRADIAMTSRPIKLDEAQLLYHTHGDMRSIASEHVLAIDGIVIVINPQNPITSLDIDTIAKIFSGEVTNWKSLGAFDMRINVYSRDNQSGTFDTFDNLVLKNKLALSDAAQRVSSNEELSKKVSGDIASIGFVGMAYTGRAKVVAVGDKDSSPLSPAPLFIATEDYPLSRRLFMYTAEQNDNPQAKDFVKFALSKHGQQVVENSGFVSMNPIKTKVTDLDGPADYEALTREGERLSVNFRFHPGEARLDNKARHDVLRVAEYLKMLGDKNYHVKLVGFSNPKHSSARAELLSRLRANVVKIALFRHGVDTDKVLGFGADVLVANSRGLQGVKNDRVEVWVVENPRTEDKLANLSL